MKPFILKTNAVLGLSLLLMGTLVQAQNNQADPVMRDGATVQGDTATAGSTTTTGRRTTTTTTNDGLVGVGGVAPLPEAGSNQSASIETNSMRTESMQGGSMASSSMRTGYTTGFLLLFRT